VADPHQFNANPDSSFHFDADSDLTFHFNADTDPDPTLHFEAVTDPAMFFLIKVIRILLLTSTLMRIRIQYFMHTDADSDPRNWKHPYYAWRK
jgi:hypothetical protein